jgi:hypothetical protein
VRTRVSRDTGVQDFDAGDAALRQKPGELLRIALEANPAVLGIVAGSIEPEPEGGGVPQACDPCHALIGRQRGAPEPVLVDAEGRVFDAGSVGEAQNRVVDDPGSERAASPLPPGLGCRGPQDQLCSE